MNRVTFKTDQTVNDLMQKASSIVSLPPEALIVDIEGKLVSTYPGQTKLKSAPGFEYYFAMKLEWAQP